MTTAIVFPPDCEVVVRALWDYLDGTLGPPSMAAIDAHLAECAPCRTHAAFQRKLIDEICALRRQHDDPSALRVRVLDAIRRARATDG
jgi:anti-sigma factor (TIGR02949 family)